MLPIRQSPHRVSYRLRLESLEDRLLLSAAASCPTLVDGASTSAAAQVDTSTCPSQSEAVQDSSTSASSPTTCPLAGGVTNSLDLATSPAATPYKTGPTSSAAYPVLNSANPEFLLPPLSLAFMSGGETRAVEETGPNLIPADTESNSMVANGLLVNTDEHELSWVNDPENADHDQAMPGSLLARAGEIRIQTAHLGQDSQLITEYQPLDKSSPFLIASLRSVSATSAKSETRSTVESHLGSAVVPGPIEFIESGALPAARTEGLPAGACQAELTPQAILETSQDYSADRSIDDDGYLFGSAWHPAAQVAIPVACFALAYAVHQTQREPEKQRPNQTS